MNAHWEITTVPAGFQLTLVGANGEEVLRAMTIYNDKDDAFHAITLARTASRIDENQGV